MSGINLFNVLSVALCFLMTYSVGVSQNTQGSYETIMYFDYDYVEMKDSNLSTIKRWIMYDSASGLYNFEDYDLLNACNFFIQRGQLKSLKPEIKHGKFVHIDYLGNTVTSLYQNNEFVDIIDYRNNKDSVLDPIYNIKDVEESYEFLEGEANFLSSIISNVKLKNDFDFSKVKSRVYIKFVVEKDGSITNLDIMNDGYTLSENILETLNTIKVKPAKRNSKVVRSYVFLPIYVCLR